MGDLNSKQRAHLRSLAHSLKPVVQVGSAGVTDAVLQAVRESFHTRELVKIRVLESAPKEVREIAVDLAGASPGALLVHTIGRTAVLYRPHPERPDIRLP